MTNDLDLVHQIEAAQERLSQIQQQATARSPDHNQLLSAAIMETSGVLEELQVTVEAMRQQNDALLVAKHHLEDERQRYQNLFDFAPEAYVVTDAQGKIEAINGMAAELLNVRSPFAEGKPLAVFVDPADRGFIYSQLSALTRQSEPAKAMGAAARATILQNQELSILPRKREPIKVALSGSVERDRQGRIRLYWLLRDISERKQLEVALQTSEAQLSQILDGAIAAIISFRIFEDGDWEYNYFSSGCESILGYAPEAFMADKRLWRSRMHPDDLDNIKPLFDRLFVERSTVSESRFLHRDGSLRWLSSTYASQKIAEGCWQVTVVGHDITERKRAEAALKRQIQQEYLLNDITEDIRQSLDLEAVLARAVERSRAVLESDRVIVFRFLGNGKGQVIAESVDNGFVPILASTIDDPCFSDHYIEVYRQGRVSAIDDLEQADLEPCHRDLLRQFQVKANLVVPILRRDAGSSTVRPSTQPDELWGLLIVHHCAAPRQWQPAEIALLKRIASKTSVAIQQSELYGQVLQELQERERIQQVLQQSEARFRTLSATAPVGIAQIDSHGQFVYTNARWQAIAGLSAEASMGAGWLQVVHPDDRWQLALAWREHRVGGQPRLPEFRLLTPKGDVRWVEVAIAPMHTATGDISGYVSTVADITQRKAADRKLREQAALLDIASDAIFVHDLDHRLLYWNHGAERLYGWSAAEVLGCPVQDLLHTNLPELCIMHILHREGEWQGELEKVTKTGQTVTVSARWTLVPDEAGQPQYILSVETDITEKKAFEAQFYQAQRLESLGRLSSGIAHDLNNVFTPILTMAQLLRHTQKGLGDSAQQQLRLLEDSAKRGISMVQQILSITRTSSGVRTTVDLPPLLRDLSQMLEQSLPRQIRLQLVGFEAGEALPCVSADPTHLHQVLMNLCVNARDAMPDGGTLTIAAAAVTIDAATAAMHPSAQVGQYVRLTVADTGTGIDPALRDRIFDPFFTTKGQGQGTGLGLATVLGIVQGSEGFVQVESEVGKGTQMQVYLPALVTAEGNCLPVAEPQPPGLGHGEVILWVDDDDAVQQAGRSLLVNYNYKPLVASGGHEALELCTLHQPALVVLDIMMPGMDGLTLIQQLMHHQPHLLVVATSGLATYESAALTAGANVFLPKPYDFHNLLKTVADLLG